MEFRYKAKKSLNELVEGNIEAESVDQVVEFLERKGMLAVSVEEAPKSAQSRGKVKQIKAKFGRWGGRKLTVFTQKLYNLIKSRVELLSSLKILQQSGNDPTEKALLEDIIKSIKDGLPFSQCLARFPQYFSPLYINIIRAGESSGQLKDALAQILSYLERLDNLKLKIRQALAYPIFMVIVGIVTIYVMLTFILPKLLGMFEDFQSALPLPTRILLDTSGFLKQYWFAGFFFILLAVFFFKKYANRIKFHLPLIRNIIHKQALANFSTSTSLLLKSGVTLLSALGIVAPVMGDAAYVKKLELVADAIKDGDSFSNSLSKFKVFPEFFIQMLRVGEEAGRLDSVLEDLAATYEQEIDSDLKIISSLLEPAIILILGLIIGGIVIAVLLPIFNINTLVGS
ncbi:MAG: type II secretion system F family protein [Candidatus Omnitrophica bacterium]|nr:type II secretion system F family protein [Candidatus Omnitrophota bacterium]